MALLSEIDRMAQPRETLARIHLFRSLGDEDIRALDARCLWRRYGAGAEVLSQGEGGTDVYFVLSGACGCASPRRAAGT